MLIVTLIQLEKRKEELRLSKEDLIESLEEIHQVQNGVAKAITGVSRKEHTLAKMLEGIQTDLARKGIRITIAENGSVLRIPENQLQFAIGQYDIPPSYRETANAIGRALDRALRKPENCSLLDTVFLEGHTDSVPNHNKMGNWGLSTYRAISLWSFWTENPGELAELKNLRTMPKDLSQDPKPLISVSGYADTRSTHGLLDGLKLKDNRSEDRRIDIRFTLASSEKADLQSLQKNVDLMRDKTSSLLHKLKDGLHEH